MTPSAAEILKRQVDIVEVIGQYVRLRRHGLRWIGLSPFRDERTPSFVVFSDHFHDFGTGDHGDVIDFVQRRECVTFPEAVSILAERYGLPADASSKHKAKPRHSEQTLSRASLLIVGLRWRLDGALETAKCELWGPRHEQAAYVVKRLTAWRARIDTWTQLRLNGNARDPRSFWEIAWTGRRQQEEAIELLRKLPRKVVRECMGEAAEANRLLARAISGQPAERAA